MYCRKTFILLTDLECVLDITESITETLHNYRIVKLNSQFIMQLCLSYSII